MAIGKIDLCSMFLRLSALPRWRERPAVCFPMLFNSAIKIIFVYEHEDNKQQPRTTSKPVYFLKSDHVLTFAAWPFASLLSNDSRPYFGLSSVERPVKLTSDVKQRKQNNNERNNSCATKKKPHRFLHRG